MKLSEIKNQFKIDMIETTRGCPEACLHCGAYQGFDINQLTVQCVESPILKEYFLRYHKKNNLRTIDLFNKYVTTYVNTEPLCATNFINFTKLVFELSRGRSQVIALSHGLMMNNQDMRNKLEKIIDLMRAGVIPLFVLTVDSARMRGKIPTQINKDCYLETLQLLRNALPYGRITVSLQGSLDSGSPLWIGKTQKMFVEILKLLKLSPEESKQLVIDNRSYTNIGRSKNFLNLTTSDDCDVIPDPEFIKKQLPNNYEWRGMLRFDGSLLVQKNRPGMTYGDSVTPNLWQEVECD